MKKILKNKIRYVAAVIAVVCAPLLSGCGSSSSGYVVDLEIWGPLDDATVYSEIINQYKKINPYVGEIKYRKFSMATYKQEILDALASGQGPDIFMVSNDWIPYFQNKVNPAPTPFVGESDIKNDFPDVVENDFVVDGKVLAVPLSVDSMVLYYNRDMFNSAGIASPPKTWYEFDDDIEKLTKVDAYGNIERSGAAIGTTDNVNQFADLLGVLMMQNGVEMPMKSGEIANFDEGIINSNGDVVQAGELALGYYAKFANPVTDANTMNQLYTWNKNMADSTEAFSEGRVGMMFNYSWKYADVKSRNEKLNFGIAQIPQVNQSKALTSASYWGYAVTKNKATAAMSGQVASPVSNDMRMHEAWQFLRFLTLKNTGTVRLYNAITKNSKDFPINFDPAADYLERTQQPAARRDLIEIQKTDPILGVFASSNLIAKHWYQYDPYAIDGIFKYMIDSVNNKSMTLHEALQFGKSKINAYSQ